MPEIIIIHSLTEDLRFLSKIKKTIPQHYNETKRIILKCDSASHDQALSIIRNSTEEDLVIFLGHGRTDGLFGCSFKASNEQHPRYFKYGIWIGKENYNIFEHKKIFCLACNSNYIGSTIVNKFDTQVFLGFNDVEFDYPKKNYYKPNKTVESIAKYEFVRIVKNSLSESIKNSYSFYQCASLLRLRINKTCDHYILDFKENKSCKYMLKVANCLNLIKEGIMVWGDGNLPLIC